MLLCPRHALHNIRYCLGAGLAMVEMKVLLALVARHYTFVADNNTEWQNAIGRVPKVSLCWDDLGRGLCAAACQVLVVTSEQCARALTSRN